jgi:glycine dehydrogenase subunit 1
VNPYIANTDEQARAMLAAIGVKTIDDLFRDILPEHAPVSFDLPGGLSEFEVMAHLRGLAAKNTGALVPFIGGGYYDHYVPEACAAIMSRGEFFTAYTPYQPECSQGTLQALFEYQSGICALTGMDVANASLYDGGTALYEAMMMAIRITGRTKIVMDSGVSPIYRKLIRSYTHNLHFEFVEPPVVHGQTDRAAIARLVDDRTAAVIISNPNFFGVIDDHRDVAAAAHAAGALLVASVYPVVLGLLRTPAETGVDIVTGEGQSLGLPLNFGGPYLGFMATRRKFIRQLPGRIVGETVDAQGRRCFVNTLQAREQHIRREKATSNICTNAALCAVQASVFMSLLGRRGFAELAQLNLDKAEFARQTLARVPGVEVKRSSPTFNEFAIHLSKDAGDVVEAMIPRGFAAGFPLGRYYPGMEKYLLVAVTEKRTKAEILAFAAALKEVLACN